MFLNLLRRWWHRRHTHIYQYFDGRKLRRADPLRLWRAILAHQDYREDDWKMLEVDSPYIKLQAIERLSRVFRQSANVRIAEDGGLPDAECVQLLREFVNWQRVQKKSTVQTQTLLDFTAILHCHPVIVSTSDFSESTVTSTEFTEHPHAASWREFGLPSMGPISTT